MDRLLVDFSTMSLSSGLSLSLKMKTIEEIVPKVAKEQVRACKIPPNTVSRRPDPHSLSPSIESSIPKVRGPEGAKRPSSSRMHDPGTYESDAQQALLRTSHGHRDGSKFRDVPTRSRLVEAAAGLDSTRAVSSTSRFLTPRSHIGGPSTSKSSAVAFAK